MRTDHPPSARGRPPGAERASSRHPGRRRAHGGRQVLPWRLRPPPCPLGAPRRLAPARRASCSRRRDFLPAVPGWLPERQTRRWGNPGTRGRRAGARRGGDTVGPRRAGAPGRSRPPRRCPWGRGPGVLPAPALRSSRLALAAGVAGGGARPCPIPAHPAPSVGLRSASPRRVWRPHGPARV